MAATSPLPFLGSSRSLEELHTTHARYQAVEREIAAETGTTLIETARALALAGHTFSAADLAHPNARGAAAIARRLAAQFRCKAVKTQGVQNVVVLLGRDAVLPRPASSRA